MTIVGASAVTFALRLSFIALLGRIETLPLLGRALRFVPAAVLTAVVIPHRLPNSNVPVNVENLSNVENSPWRPRSFGGLQLYADS